MLYLIGLGLGKGDLSIAALNALKNCKKVYLETYTSSLPYSVRELERLIGKPVTEVGREVVESDILVREAKVKSEDIALLVPGDPLSATTHITLLEQARKANVAIKIFHSASVLTAVAETGLQLYKFGKTASIPAWKEGYKPESFFDVYEQNKNISAHTLFLLDPGLTVKQAFNQLLTIAKKKNDKLGVKSKCIVCARLGADSVVKYGSIKKLLKIEFGAEPYCIILPGKLHFAEEEFLGGLEV